MPKIVLHGHRLSPFVEKVYRALGYKGLPFDFREIRSPLELRRLNPQTRKMPVLDVDGERIYDSTFILRRLDQLRPEPPLLSRDARVAAAQQQLEDWSDEALYWYSMGLRWAKENRVATVEQLAAGMPLLLRPLAHVLLPRLIGGMARAQGLGRLPHDLLLRELGRRLDELVTLLGSSPFFYAEHPSVADFAVYGQLHLLASGPTPEAEALLGERAALADFGKRVEEASGAR